MPTLTIPCIRKFRDGGGDVDVQFAFTPGEDGGIDVYILITPPDSPVDIAIVPFPPFVLPIPDFSVIFDDLFGKSRIQIQKDEIQKYLTQAFRYAFNNYGYPLQDDHALQFKSSGVRREFLARPDLAILAEAMWTDADSIVTGSFGYDKSGPGIRERFVNQFLANAAYNNWPVQATLDLWHALIRASNCIKGVPLPDPNAPPLPLPPNPPPPGEPAQCPPGYTQDECQTICGQIRQLTAGQQPLTPELQAVLQYFPDCVLPPDGSWRYLAPAWRQTWDVGPISAFPWADQTSEIRMVPPWAWPYNWPQDGKGVWEVTRAPQGARFPEGSLFVMGRSPDQYAILPNGQPTCFYPPPEGPPDPPDPDEPDDPPPPPDLRDTVSQLRQDLDALRAEYQQFKLAAQQQFDSLKDVIWRTNIRGNFQAAEVYAADQPGWQGPRPAAQEPGMPPGWQALPTPGFPQVLELPPIQPFPQAPAPQPFDPTPLERQINEIIDTNSQQWDKLEEIERRTPMLIDEAINLYDQNVEKPDLQKLRDECCQPAPEPDNPSPTDYCQLGRDHWGRMAECWHEANTEPVEDPFAFMRTTWDDAGLVNAVKRIVSGQLTTAEQELRRQGDAAFQAGLNGTINNPPGLGPIDQRPWIYEDPSVLEAPSRGL
jgi:hypothetical protein